MIRSFFFVWSLLALPGWANAQRISDLSVDLYDLAVHPQIGLSYERAISPKFSLLGKASYGEGNDLLFDTGLIDTIRNPLVNNNGDTLAIVTSRIREHSQTQALYLTIGGRYYFIPKTSLDRVFVGLSLRYRTYTKIEDNYPEETAPDQYALQIESGYKWIVKNKIPIETGISLQLFEYTENTYRSLLFGGALLLKIGYRFGGGT